MLDNVRTTVYTFFTTIWNWSNKHNRFFTNVSQELPVIEQERTWRPPHYCKNSILTHSLSFTGFDITSGDGYPVTLEGAVLQLPEFLCFIDSAGRAGAILVLLVLLIIQRIGAATPPPKRPSSIKRREEHEKAIKDGGDIACNCRKGKPRGVIPWLIKFFTS